MQGSQTTCKNGYSSENRMESEGNMRACSTSRGEAERKDGVSPLVRKLISRENLNRAYLRVKANNGSPGVDGRKASELKGYLSEHGDSLVAQLKDGSYEPQPVLRKEVDKEDGSTRKLGIPTVVDRFVQQAILQVIEKRIDKTFSEFSFGFRPNRSTHDAMYQAKEHYEEGYRTVVDIDLKQYFDTVNHDKLMYHVEEHIQDTTILKLIRKFLRSGVSIDDVVYPTEIGCPQGGNLSPILSNIISVA